MKAVGLIPGETCKFIIELNKFIPGLLLFISGGNMEDFDILNDLNESQKEAVTTTEGFIRVVAGAGSGKTRALSSRFAYLVNDLGILPGNILCVTFTSKAANEMRRRIHNLTGDNDTGYINTFHGFCVSVLQEEAHVVQYPKSFLVLDISDIDEMLRMVYEERNLTLRDMTYSDARDMIEMIKLVERPHYYQDLIEMDLEMLRVKYNMADNVKDIIFYGYLYQQKKCFGLDYDDLISFVLYIFSKNEESKLKWQKRLEYIMIDEFQDIDRPQYDLMQVLCGYHHNLFIVGDPDQTIYTWRGASTKFLMDFDRQYSDCKTIMMMQNYRSTPEILATANSLIAKNTDRIEKNLIPTLPSGDKVVAKFAPNQEKEAEWISQEIRKLHESGVDYRDITVMYRAHFLTRSVEQQFLKDKIPYTIYSGVQFFERAEIKTALSYLRCLALRDDMAFKRVINTPKRNMGQRRMGFLEDYASLKGVTLYQALLETIDESIFNGTQAREFVALMNEMSEGMDARPISELLSDILNKSGYEEALRTEGAQDRLDNLAELKQSIYEFETSCGEETTLADYLRHVALYTNTDLEDTKDRVKMMTVHAAKGLEFPYIFLCGMNEGIFPSKKSRTREAMEEERRVAFVAYTRAMKRLYLSMAEGRNFDGSPRYPSRFILEPEEGLIEYVEQPREGLIKETYAYIGISERVMKGMDDTTRLPVGTRVKHMIFGEGEIIDIDNDRNAYVVKFDGQQTERVISFKVKLETLSGDVEEGKDEKSVAEETEVEKSDTDGSIDEKSDAEEVMDSESEEAEDSSADFD